MIGHPLAHDWAPSESDVMYGLGLGLTTPAIEDAAESMRLWASANANRQIARKANWTAAFRGWMRREAAKRGTHGSTNPTIAAFDKIIDLTASDRIEDGTRRPDDTPGSGETGQTTDWLFPPRSATGS